MKTTSLQFPHCSSNLLSWFILYNIISVSGGSDVRQIFRVEYNTWTFDIWIFEVESWWIFSEVGSTLTRTDILTSSEVELCAACMWVGVTICHSTRLKSRVRCSVDSNLQLHILKLGFCTWFSVKWWRARILVRTLITLCDVSCLCFHTCMVTTYWYQVGLVSDDT